LVESPGSRAVTTRNRHICIIRWAVNRHLVTPVIVLVSFAATCGYMSWRAGLWHVASPDKLPEAARTPSVTVAPPATLPLHAVPGSAADEPVQRQATAVTPDPESVPTDAFLAARDRAAAHSSRSH
jgi:hypothetical protein